MERKGTLGQLLITVAAMMISLLVMLGSNGLIGAATGAFAFTVFTILDSIDDNLSTMARIAKDQRGRAETYDAKGERVDAQA